MKKIYRKQQKQIKSGCRKQKYRHRLCPKRESLSNGFIRQMPAQGSGRQGKGDKGTHEAQDTTCYHMGKQTKA